MLEHVPESLTLFLCGDVMTGRGIDQVLPNPSDARLYEPYVRDARDYVSLAEQTNGPIPKPARFEYIWGDALAELTSCRPDARIINLETAVTTSGIWEDKGINYRMHPANVTCLTAAAVDVCVLANNHVLDWGYWGLDETLRVLHDAGIRTTGAGMNGQQASMPAVIELTEERRVLIFGAGHGSSGIPATWAASGERAGVTLLHTLSASAANDFGGWVKTYKRPGDIVVASIHWGGNWGYDIPQDQITFAHDLIERAGVDIVHGHSSHHVKGIEVYKERLVLYGCGDFINDYEGITGYESYHDDLGFMYFPTLDNHGRLRSLRLVPTRIRNFRVNHAQESEVRWLWAVLNREGRPFGTHATRLPDGSLNLRWP